MDEMLAATFSRAVHERLDYLDAFDVPARLCWVGEEVRQQIGARGSAGTVLARCRTVRVERSVRGHSSSSGAPLGPPGSSGSETPVPTSFAVAPELARLSNSWLVRWPT